MTRPAFLLDTNIWLDVEMPGDNHDEARAFIVSARRADARLGIASHSLKDVYFLLQRRLKLENRGDRAIPVEKAGPAARAVAWAIVQKILETAEVVGSDGSDAHIAVRQRVFHNDYEDNLVVAAAVRMQADYLVTSDAALLKHAPVATLSPEDATKWLEWTGGQVGGPPVEREAGAVFQR